MSKPYINYDITTNKNTKQFVRLIPEHSEDTELKWHRDTYDRVITIKSGLNWYLQFDNQLPIELIINQKYYIQKDIWHRVIKGQENLIIDITEFF
jgi:hypothetical protein